MDGIAYWKNAHAKSQSAVRILCDRVHELEQEIQELLATPNARNGSIAPANTPRKRKRDDERDERLAAVVSRRKRSKNDVSITVSEQEEARTRAVLEEIELSLSGAEGMVWSTLLRLRSDLFRKHLPSPFLYIATNSSRV